MRFLKGNIRNGSGINRLWLMSEKTGLLSWKIIVRMFLGITVYRVGYEPSGFCVPFMGQNKRREVEQMDTYEVLTLLFLGGTFLIALLAYLDNRNNKAKK